MKCNSAPTKMKRRTKHLIAVYTLILLISGIGPFCITNKWVTVACIALYVPLCLFWLFIGFGQLASCIDFI